MNKLIYTLFFMSANVLGDEIDDAFKAQNNNGRVNTAVDGSFYSKSDETRYKVYGRAIEIEQQRAEKMRNLLAVQAEEERTASGSSSSSDRSSDKKSNSGNSNFSSSSSKRDAGDGMKTFSCLVHCLRGRDTRYTFNAKSQREAADYVGDHASEICDEKQGVMATSKSYSITQCSEK